MSDSGEARIRELERVCQEAPGDEAFPALAELYRRAGRLAEAERTLLRGLAASPGSQAGRAVLLLMLQDAGRGAELRRHLESWADDAVRRWDRMAPPPVLLPEAEIDDADLSDREIDRAFDTAEPDREQMITPDTVAEEATLRADGLFAAQSPLESTSTFATRTMAELLERQGDLQGAARIRAVLERGNSRPGSGAPAPQRHAAMIATLERWLENARRIQT